VFFVLMQRWFASIAAQSIERLSSLKIIVLHFLIRKSANDRRARRSSTKTSVTTSETGAATTPPEPNLK
jgi:hypothetical protein